LKRSVPIKSLVVLLMQMVRETGRGLCGKSYYIPQEW